MSRIGKMPINVPENVDVKISETEVFVKGQKGELKLNYIPEVSISLKDSVITISQKGNSKEAKSFFGLYRSIVNNIIIGVSKGYSKTLEIIGVGYRVELKGNDLIFNLGYSMQINYVAPEGISLKNEGTNKVIVSGIDKALVGKVAAEIRSLRPPEPYKGKGIKYSDEIIRRKVGKSGVK